MITNNGATSNLLGLSTDVKPADAEINTIFLELDTGDFYYFDGIEWAVVGAESEG